MAFPETIKQLLDGGVHFGHLRKHWNPKMKKFIFGRKKNVYIIDLEKTAQRLEEAKDFVKNIAQSGKKVLFIATKKQLRDTIREQAIACKMPYITERWVGGFLTNCVTIRSRVKRYTQLLEKREKGELEKMPQKEFVRLNRELINMEKNYKGVIGLDDLPACVFVVDPKKEIACVREAMRLSIPIVAIVDTDSDPDVVDYPIPGNDDAIRSVKCLSGHITEAINAGFARAQEVVDAAKLAEQPALPEIPADEDPDVTPYEELDEKLSEKEKEIKRAMRAKEGTV